MCVASLFYTLGVGGFVFILRDGQKVTFLNQLYSFLKSHWTTEG